MKKMIQFTLGATLLISSFGAKAENLFAGTTQVVMFPPVMSTLTSGGMYTCMTDQSAWNEAGNPNNCQKLTASGVGATALYASSTILLLKEEAKMVEPDAYQYLAGEEMTLHLEETINKAREEHPELAQLDDKDVAILLLETLNF